MFSICIRRNENYSCLVHDIFEHVQNFLTDMPKLHAWEEHCSNGLSLSLPEWPGMTRNDQEWSPIQTRMVNSSSFGSIFSTVRLRHSMCASVVSPTETGTLKDFLCEICFWHKLVIPKYHPSCLNELIFKGNILSFITLLTIL